MWYNRWFGTHYYDLLYDHRNETEAHAFIDNIVEVIHLPTPATILDLGCGKGRHALYLHKLGYHVTGIDLSAENIAHCKTFETQGLEFYVHDMRRYFRTNNFDCVLNLFTSFGYFERIHHNLMAVKAAAANLKQGGYLVMDYFNAYFVENNLGNDTIVCKGNVVFRISKKIENNFVIKTINVEDKGDNQNYYERVEMLFPHHFEQLLHEAGLSICDTYGSYDLMPYHKETSPRYVVVAQKI